MWDNIRAVLPPMEGAHWQDWQHFLDESVATLLVLLIAGVVYLFCSRLLGRVGRRTHLDASMVFTLRAVLRWLFVLLTLAAVLQVWHVLEQFWAAATALVTLIAVGFVAVWSVLSNVLCSVILLASRPFRIGQRVEFPPDDLAGTVEEVGLVHTTLRTDDQRKLLIPNNLFFQRIVRVENPHPAFHPLTRENESDNR